MPSFVYPVVTSAISVSYTHMAGYASFLINMPDEDNRRMRFLGKAQDGGGTFPYLGNSPRRRFKGFGRNRLYGVDDDDVRAICV